MICPNSHKNKTSVADETSSNYTQMKIIYMSTNAYSENNHYKTKYLTESKIRGLVHTLCAASESRGYFRMWMKDN